MIISLHVPKTAGTSFQQVLKREYGERLMLDYGDWVGINTQAAIVRRAQRAAEMRQRRDQLLASYEVIHGHFLAEKYVALFPCTDFVAFFRDPYQQTISNYYFLLRHPEAQEKYPAVKVFHDAKMTIDDYVAWEDVRGPQADMISGLTVDDIAVVGLSEEFDRGIALYNSVFGSHLESDFRLNANPSREQDVYPVTDGLKKLIDVYREKDIVLYRRAKERFAQLAARHGV